MGLRRRSTKSPGKCSGWVCLSFHSNQDSNALARTSRINGELTPAPASYGFHFNYREPHLNSIVSSPVEQKTFLFHLKMCARRKESSETFIPPVIKFPRERSCTCWATQAGSRLLRFLSIWRADIKSFYVPSGSSAIKFERVVPNEIWDLLCPNICHEHDDRLTEMEMGSRSQSFNDKLS